MQVLDGKLGGTEWISDIKLSISTPILLFFACVLLFSPLRFPYALSSERKIHHLVYRCNGCLAYRKSKRGTK